MPKRPGETLGPMAAPVLDLEMAKQWFAGGDAADQTQDRAMVDQLRRDVPPRLSALQTMTTGPDGVRAKGELHKLRGAVSSFGFSASSEYLKQLELGWDKLDPDTRKTKLAAAEETFLAGVRELVRQYPHLGQI